MVQFEVIYDNVMKITFFFNGMILSMVSSTLVVDYSTGAPKLSSANEKLLWEFDEVRSAWKPNAPYIRKWKTCDFQLIKTC